MPSNNLNGVRIADNQTSGQHRTANDALNTLDAALTNTGYLYLTDTNTYSVSANTLAANFRFEISYSSPAPNAAVTIIFAGTAVRGLTMWKNTLSYPATLYRSGQTEPYVVIPAGSAALIEYDGSNVRMIGHQQPFFHTVAVSDETTPITAGTSKVTFRMPCRMWLTGVRASLNAAQTSGTAVTVDINMTGSTILSTKLTIDNTEKTSVTAATPAVIGTNLLADDAEITVDIDAVGSGGAAGLKITLIGYRY